MNPAQNTVSAGLAAMNALLNGGTLVIYAGAMPASPETALSGQTALATWTFAATAFGAPSFSSGSMQASAAFASNSATPTASGTATWARAYRSSGTAVADYTVGTAGADIIMSSTTISAGAAETITSMTHTMPAV